MITELVAIAFTGRAVSIPPTLDAFPGAAFDGTKGAWRSGVMETLAAGCLEPVMGAKSSAEVPTSGTRLQMLRVNAVPDPTAVVQVHLPVERTELPDVEGAVGQLSSTDDPGELPISIRVDGALPQPAPIRVNAVPSPVVDQRVGRGSSAMMATPMLMTHAEPQSTRNAFRIVNAAHCIHVGTVHQEGG